MADVKIQYAHTGQWRPGKGWAIGHVAALVDGVPVSYRHRGGWRCRCAAGPDCEHVTAVAPLVDPDTLAGITEGRRPATAGASS